jgi:hypothetical protein
MSVFKVVKWHVRKVPHQHAPSTIEEDFRQPNMDRNKEAQTTGIEVSSVEHQTNHVEYLRQAKVTWVEEMQWWGTQMVGEGTWGPKSKMWSPSTWTSHNAAARVPCFTCGHSAFEPEFILSWGLLVVNFLFESGLNFWGLTLAQLISNWGYITDSPVVSTIHFNHRPI